MPNRPDVLQRGRERLWEPNDLDSGLMLPSGPPGKVLLTRLKVITVFCVLRLKRFWSDRIDVIMMIIAISIRLTIIIIWKLVYNTE